MSSNDFHSRLSQKEALLRSEERLNLILSTRDIGIWEWDILTGKIIWSDTMEKMFGFEPGTFPGTYEAYRSRVPPEDFAVIERSVKRAIEDHSEHITHHRVIWPNGEIRWLTGKGKVHFDPSGKPTYMMGTLIDITEQKRSAEDLEYRVAVRTAELSESRASLDSVIENLPNMVFVKSAKDLRFVRFNRAGEDLLGFSREDLIGKNDYDFFPKEQADFFIEKDRAVLRGHEIVDIPEEEIQTKHRGKRILHTKKIPLFDIHGKPEYLLGISEDITEHKLAEEQRMNLIREQIARAESDRAAERARFLAEAGMKLSSILNTEEILKVLTSLVVPSYSDWCTVAVEPKAGMQIERAAAVHADPNLQGQLNEFFDKYSVHSDRTNGILGVMQTGKALFTSIVPDALLVQAAKDTRHLELMRALGTKSSILTPIKVRDNTIGVISFIYGNSGRIYNKEDLAMLEELGRRVGIAIENARLYEQAQQAIQLRNEFLSIASHELKTPVTSLKLRLQVGKKRALEPIHTQPDKLVQTFNAAEKQVNRLIDLIEELLDISRIESGKLVYSFEVHSLSDIVQEVLEQLADQFLAAGSTVTSKLEPRMTIWCDRFRVEQVVVNLLSNAIKYGAGRPIEVNVKSTEDTVLLEVSDQGMGISLEDQQRIFDRFVRVNSHRNISGLGLGLYITKQIIASHRGTLSVKSAPGQGSTFTAEFPSLSH